MAVGGHRPIPPSRRSSQRSCYVWSGSLDLDLESAIIPEGPTTPALGDKACSETEKVIPVASVLAPPVQKVPGGIYMYIKVFRCHRLFDSLGMHMGGNGNPQRVSS